MASQTLVEPDIDLGQEAANAILADKALHVSTVLWWFEEAKQKWSLLVATPNYEWHGAQAVYLKIGRLFDKVGIGDKLPLSKLWVVSDTHEIPTTLGRMLAGTRFRLQALTVDRLPVEDAYIYRLSKPPSRPRKKSEHS